MDEFYSDEEALLKGRRKLADLLSKNSSHITSEGLQSLFQKTSEFSVSQNKGSVESLEERKARQEVIKSLIQIPQKMEVIEHIAKSVSIGHGNILDELKKQQQVQHNFEQKMISFEAKRRKNTLIFYACVILLALASALIPYNYLLFQKRLEQEKAIELALLKQKAEAPKTENLIQKISSESRPIPEKELVTLKFVNLRKLGSVDAPVITTLGPNMRLTILDSAYGWYKVKTYDHVKSTEYVGWLYQDYVTKI